MFRVRWFAPIVALLASFAVSGAPALADAGGTVHGKIVLESGALPVPLERAVEVTAFDFLGNPVGRVRYHRQNGALGYDITGLPLGGTLLVKLSLRDGRAASRSGDGAIPALSRNDHSSPVYAFLLPRSAPVKAPLDFRVAVTPDPAPAYVANP